MTLDNPQVPGAVSELYVPDQLIAGRFPLETGVDITLTGDAVYQRGTVLGRITASGKYTISLSAAEDGSQNPCAILADVTDTTGGDVNCAVYLAGEFNANALTLGTGWTTATIAVPLRALGIFIRNAVSAAAPS